MTVKHSGDIPLEEVSAGTDTARQVLIGENEGPNFAMRRFVIQPGGGMPKHTNSVEHEQYVLRGRAEVGIGGQIHRVAAGDAVYIPAEVPHWYKVEGEEAFEFLCMVPNLPDEIKVVE
jgi:quercetin dioxygenase-like cupin family protein